jgi:hypothetical protein
VVLYFVPRSPEVQRVFNSLDRIRQAPARPAGSKPRTIILSDADLNAYVNYRIKTEKGDILRDLRLKALSGDEVEGMMSLDLTRIGIPGFRRVFHFFFSGRLVSRDSRVKFEVKSLFLEYKPVPVFLLNMAFYIASKTQKHGPSGFVDWYELPLGISEIRTEPGRFILKY